MNILKEAIRELNEAPSKYFLGSDDFAKHLVDDYKVIPHSSGNQYFRFSKTLLDTFIHPSPLLSLDKQDTGYFYYSNAKQEVIMQMCFFRSYANADIEPLINHIFSKEAQEKLKQFLKMDYLDFNFKKALADIRNSGNHNFDKDERFYIAVGNVSDPLKRYIDFRVFIKGWEIRITFGYNSTTDKFEYNFSPIEIMNCLHKSSLLPREFDLYINLLKEILELSNTELNLQFKQFNEFITNLNLNQIGDDWIKLTKADLFGKPKVFKVKQADWISDATFKEACDYVLDKIPAELNNDDLNALFLALDDFCEYYKSQHVFHLYSPLLICLFLYKVLEIDVAENTDLFYAIEQAVTPAKEGVINTLDWIPTYYITKELLSKVNTLIIHGSKSNVFIEEGLTVSDLSNFNIKWFGGEVQISGSGIILHLPSSLTGHLDLFKLIDLSLSINHSVEIRITPVKDENGKLVSPFEIPKAEYEELKRLREDKLTKLSITFTKN